jgi:hypothetical protein
MRKTDPRAKLKTLPSDIQEALWNYLEEDPTRTLKDAASYLHEEHHITTDFRRLSEWRGWYARKLEIESAESEATEIAQALQHSGQFNAAQLEELGNVIFLNRATKLGDAKTFTAVAQVLQGRQRMEAEKVAHKDKIEVAREKVKLQRGALEQTKRRLDQAERKITALEEQAAAAKAAAQRTKDALQSGGMDETKRAQLIAEMDHLILGKPKPKA